MTKGQTNGRTEICVLRAAWSQLKNVEKSPENVEKSKNLKNNCQILKITFLQKSELMSSSIQQANFVPNLKNLILTYKDMIAKNEFDLLLAVNYIKVTQ